MKTIKEHSCPGLSGNNTLTYEIGMENDQSFWLRLVKSSGGGFLCKDWVSVDAVMDTLRKSASPFTSYAIHTHYSGKSINSPSFLMAVLRHEELIVQDTIKQQAFVGNDFDIALKNFQSRMSADIAAPSPTKKKRPPRKPKRK